MADSLLSHNETLSSVKDCPRDYQLSSDPSPLIRYSIVNNEKINKRNGFYV
jgi:hypothetical protein